MELMAPVYPVQLTVALGVSHLILSRDLQTLNINSAFFLALQLLVVNGRAQKANSVSPN